LQKLPTTKEIIKTFGLTPKRALGQNFILDPTITDRIAMSAGNLSDCTIIEIGPGPGGLTKSLLTAGVKKVVAIEQDANCIKALQLLKDLYQDRLEIIHGNALNIKEEELYDGKVKIVANLPYNISTVLLFKWLESIRHYTNLTLMFQKEVALRLTAEPNCKAYGRLSIMTQWLAKTKILFDLGPEAFTPPPKVTSSIIQITPREQPLYPADYKSLEKCCKMLFNQRRKTIKNSLKQITDEPEKLLAKYDIKPTIRPENLTIKQICLLSEEFVFKI
jgi:16S rRNA (adenine1518-N6/adenine1519-N6)-dimethyltransferase